MDFALKCARSSAENDDNLFSRIVYFCLIIYRAKEFTSLRNVLRMKGIGGKTRLRVKISIELS